MSEMNGNSRLPARRDAYAAGVEPFSPAVATFERFEPSASPLGEYVGIFLRRKWTVLVCLAVIFGTTVLVTVATPRTYEATATLLVSQTRGARGIDLQGPIPPMLAAMVAPELETHVELLQGRSTAEATSAWLKENGGLSLTPAEVGQSIWARAVPRTQLVRVSARARTPEKAEKIANAVAQSYVETNRQRVRGSSESASQYLSEQLTIAKSNLTAAENTLRVFRESTGIVGTDALAGGLLERATSLGADIDNTNADLAQGQERLAKVGGQVAEQNESISAGQVRDNAVVQQLRAKLVELEGQRLAAQARYTDAFSAPLDQIDEQIRIAKEQLSAEIGSVVGSGGGDLAIQQTLTAQLIQGEAEVAALRARRRHLEAELQQVTQDMQKIPARQITLARVQRQVDIAQTIHSDLLKRSQEIEVGRVMALGNTEVVEPAAAPRLPIKPNVPRNIALGLLLGLGVGVGLALLQEQLDDTVRDEEDIARFLDAPVLGTVPMFEGQRRTKELRGPRPPSSGAIEAYRALRYSLGFVTPGEGGRVVLVTSPGPVEGKTTTAVNLATAAALSGRRVVLIEGDLRRPSFHRLLSLDGARGLTDVLVGEVNLPDVMQELEDRGLRVITSGTRAPNPTDLLDSTEMRSLVEEIRKEADLVILDSAPVLSVADTLVLAGLSDALLMVCVPGQSNRRALQRSRMLLAHIGRNISGVVLNKVEHKRGYGYYGRYDYYHDYERAEDDTAPVTDEEREAK